MNIEHVPNYSHANNVKYYLEGISARQWCYQNKASYSSYYRLKKEGYSDSDIKEYLLSRYTNRVHESSINDIAAFVRSLYLKTIKENTSISNLKAWFYEKSLSDHEKDKIWNLVISGNIQASNDVELWRKITTTKNCFISNKGNFKKKVKDKVLNYIYPRPYSKKRYNSKKEAKRIRMHIKLEGKEYAVAKLVATYFLPNPNKYRYTHIIDGNVKNLSYDNIKWISKSEAGRLTGYLSKSKPVKVRLKYKKDSKEYRSVRTAAKDLNVSYQTLLDYIKKSTRPKNSVLKKYIVEYI